MTNPGHQTIVGIKEADVHHFSIIYKKYSSRLIYFVFRLISDKAQAEDIVTDIFLKLWDRRDQFVTENNIKAFLYIAARNTSLNYLNHRNRLTNHHQNILAQTAHLQEPFYQETTAELFAMICKNIKELPPKQREVIELMVFEGLRDDEISLRLGKSVKTVSNQKLAAIHSLRKHANKGGSVIIILIAIISP